MSLWKAEQFRPTERENTPQPDTAIPEWLDRYPRLPILFGSSPLDVGRG
jgi:hypothetical protein